MTFHNIVLSICYSFPMIFAGAGVLGWLQLRSFLGSVPSIEGLQEFDRLKSLVKTNMYLALFIVSYLIAVSTICLIGVLWRTVKIEELWAFLMIIPIGTLVGSQLTALEKRVRKIPLADESLRSEYDDVIQAWKEKMFPDW